MVSIMILGEVIEPMWKILVGQVRSSHLICDDRFFRTIGLSI